MAKSAQGTGEAPRTREIGKHVCASCGHDLLAQRVTRKLAFEQDGFVERCRCPKCGHLNVSAIRLSLDDLGALE